MALLDRVDRAEQPENRIKQVMLDNAAETELAAGKSQDGPALAGLENRRRPRQ